MIRVAVTGGIGSGKSVVSEYVEKLGYTVLYTDRIAREITAPGGLAIQYIIDNFGAEYIRADGGMDRDKMRTLVMNDEAAKKVLERGTTAVVKETVDSQCALLEESGCKVVFVEVPLLFEMKAEDEYDCIWLVTADLSVKIKRITLRDGISEDEAMSVMRNQLDDSAKIAKADVVIENNGSIDDLKRHVDRALEKSLEKFSTILK